MLSLMQSTELSKNGGRKMLECFWIEHNYIKARSQM